MARGGQSGIPCMTEPLQVDLLVEGGPLLAMDAAQSYWPTGAVAVRDGSIVDVGAAEAVCGRVRAARVINASGKAVLPGFVNCHGHAGMSLLRGLAEDYPLDRWLRTTVWPLMRHERSEEVFAGTRLACLEMLMSGITCFADMWRDLDATTAAVEESGLRARLAFNMRDFSDPAVLEREWEHGIAAMERPIGPGPVRFGLSPHSLYACSDALLRRAGDALQRTGCHLQIHLAETREEVAECRTRHGAGQVERLEHFGLLSENVLIAHGVWLDDDECRRLARARASISHNVSSNMKLASGVAPLTRFKAAGLNVGLGTDSAASNNVLDPFREMRLATLMQRAVARDPSAWPAYAALEAATLHGAAALGFGHEVGSLEAGKRADIVLVDLDKPHLGPRVRGDREALASLLVFAATGDDVDTVIVEGRTLLENRTPLTLNPTEVIGGARRAVRYLLAQADKM
jgi:5-methylthioadenosine/S-adenosylhomocysteine deaminase